MEPYQVEGPTWIETERYDVTAKVPEGADADDIPVMLQALLAQRFALKLHKETRDLPAYDLTIANAATARVADECLKHALGEALQAPFRRDPIPPAFRPNATWSQIRISA